MSNMSSTRKEIEADALAMAAALDTAIHYAKMLDDHDAVRDLVVIRRRLEGHWSTILWNHAILQRIGP